jgi:polar amino acid transport system ATP-binding protein
MALETLDSTRNKKTADAPPAVRISGLRKSFDGRLVLGGIDLDVPVGRIVNIIGQSGGARQP